MLVLSRKRNEVIVLGSDIRVTVLGLSGTTVRLGIEAPRHIAIARKELVPRVEAPPTDRERVNTPPSKQTD